MWALRSASANPSSGEAIDEPDDGETEKECGQSPSGNSAGRVLRMANQPRV